MTFEARGKLPNAGGPVVVRAYEGRDALGRPTHAVRAATPRGIIMAAGPRAVPDLDPSGLAPATELIPALVPDANGGSGGAFQAATDLNGDTYPDIVLRNEEGLMEVWRLGSIGATRYDVRMEVPPTIAMDADEDGTIDLAGVVRGAAGDVLAPELIDFAIFDGSIYTDASQAAKSVHAQRAKALEALQSAPSQSPSPPESAPKAPVSDEVRLRRALLLAWHSILSGKPRADALKRLEQEAVPAPLQPEFDRYKGRIERIAR